MTVRHTHTHTHTHTQERTNNHTRAPGRFSKAFLCFLGRNTAPLSPPPPPPVRGNPGAELTHACFRHARTSSHSRSSCFTGIQRPLHDMSDPTHAHLTHTHTPIRLPSLVRRNPAPSPGHLGADAEHLHSEGHQHSVSQQEHQVGLRAPEHQGAYHHPEQGRVEDLVKGTRLALVSAFVSVVV